MTKRTDPYDLCFHNRFSRLWYPLFSGSIFSGSIFRKMADIYNCRVGFWQRQVLEELFQAVFALRGRVNFTNLARFSSLHEQTFRRHFKSGAILTAPF